MIMRKIAKIVATMALIGGFFSLFTSKNNVQAASEYLIGTGNTYEPYEIESKNGGYTSKDNGFEIDLLRAIAKEENFTYTFKMMSFNGLIQATQSDQIDAMVNGMSVTPERKEVFDFTDSYYDAGIVLAVAQDSKISAFKQLKGKTIGVKVGTISSQYAEKNKKKYGYKIKYFNESNPMWTDVKNGGIDATLDDDVVLKYGIKNGVPLKIVSKSYELQPIAMAVKKGQHQDFITKFNAGLKKIKASGEYDKIMNKYIGKNSVVKVDSKADRTFFGILKKNFPFIMQGLGETIKVAVIGIIAATIFGVILGILGISEFRILRYLSSTIIYIFRGLPMIVLAFFIYIGMPDLIGHKISLFTTAIVTLMLNEGSYIGAFVKGAFEAVDVGQWEAARSLGLSYQRTLFKVIMPQSIRLMIPSFLNQFIITIKDTSILSAIGLMELTQTGSVIISKNMEGFKVWGIIALIYLILITLLTWASKLIERKFL